MAWQDYDRDRWSKHPEYRSQRRGDGAEQGDQDFQIDAGNRELKWTYWERYGQDLPAGRLNMWRQNWQQKEQLHRMSHPGKGPKNYRRPDESIREDAYEILSRQPDLDDSGIDVDVSRGVVTLKGNVNDRRSRRLAEELVEHIYGIRDVINELKVDEDRQNRIYYQQSMKKMP